MITFLLLFSLFQFGKCQYCNMVTEPNLNKIENEEFSDWPKIIICERVSITEGLRLYNGNDAITLIIKDSLIDTIPENTFVELSELKYLFLNNSEVKNLMVDSFRGLRKLEALFLRQNKIQTIPNGVWYNLISLRMLDISFNYIKTIDDIALNDLSKLEELVLSYNFISEVNRGLFSHVTTLRSIDIAHNNMKFIDAEAFNDLPGLERLLINDNYLNELPKKLFQKNSKLKFLDISHNNLLSIDYNILPSSVQYFYANRIGIDNEVIWTKIRISEIHLQSNNISKIEGLDQGIYNLSLSNNYIHNLNDEVFEKVIDLRNLDLSFNIINLISDQAFKNLRNLESLNLANNKIQHLPVGIFRNLYYLTLLKLSSNSINNIDEFGTFFGLTSLRSLYLDNNVLQYINEKTLYVLSHLEELFLTNNNLKSFDADELLKEVPRLTFIEINYNDWRCDSLKEMTTLFTNRKIAFYDGVEYALQNVHGIACDRYGKSFSNDSPANYAMPTPLEESLKNLTGLLQKIFSSFNSNCSDNPFISNCLLRGFRKTNFYKFFDADFLNSNFVRYFNESFDSSSKQVDGNNVKDTLKETDVTVSTSTIITTEAPSTIFLVSSTPILLSSTITSSISSESTQLTTNGTTTETSFFNFLY